MNLTHIAKGGGRLSAVLKEELKMSTGLLNRAKWADGLRVNGQSVHTDYQVTPGDEIVVLLEEKQAQYPAESGPLTILYEDASLLAVDKPAGMLIHPSRNRLTGTLANLVQGHYEAQGITAAFHPLTRLDRDTFGIVLIAKSAYVHALLQEQRPRKLFTSPFLQPEPCFLKHFICTKGASVFLFCTQVVLWIWDILTLQIRGVRQFHHFQLSATRISRFHLFRKSLGFASAPCTGTTSCSSISRHFFTPFHKI